MVSKQQFGGDWTTEKLERLGKYLSAYTKILSKYGYSYFYVDAFAGTGYRELKDFDDQQSLLLPELADIEPQEFLRGSARIALECKPAFQKYIFIEKDEEKLAELKTRLCTQFPEKIEKMKFIPGDANVEIRKLCRNDWRSNRAVLFLDPFGMQVTWPTIEAIAKTKAIDLWILFPLGVAVNRMLTRDGKINEKWKSKLDEIFGSADWYNEFYEANPQIGLFAEANEMRKTADFSVIQDYYVNRLRTIFPHVAENPLQLYNSRNIPLYTLFFAAGNPKGGKTAVKIAQDIMGS
jgi:three-Cys-motif partner protein